MTDKIVATGWAVQETDGFLRVCLDKELDVKNSLMLRILKDDAKRRGARAFRVRVVEMEDGE